MDFNPINSVPRDGTPVILRDPFGREACVEISRNNVSIRKASDPLPKIFAEGGELGCWLVWKRAFPN